MGPQAMYTAISLVGVGVEVTLLAILIARRQYIDFPVFTTYIAYGVLCDAAMFFPARVQFDLLIAMAPMQYLLELAVLVEIAWKVLRPVQASIPRTLFCTFLVLVSLAAAGGIVLAWHAQEAQNVVEMVERPLRLTVGLLRMLIFAATAGFAQLLGISFKNRVLQISTALSFFSATDLMITIAERHAGDVSALAIMRAVAYILEISFLVWAFSTKEIRRTEFSPQMEQLLVTIAGRARHARTSLARTQVK